ncbi:MAG: hypothetical protein NVS9B14_02210 [Candidatus Acidiferrum sp.]
MQEIFDELPHAAGSVDFGARLQKPSFAANLHESYRHSGCAESNFSLWAEVDKFNMRLELFDQPIAQNAAIVAARLKAETTANDNAGFWKSFQGWNDSGRLDTSEPFVDKTLRQALAKAQKNWTAVPAYVTA